MTDHLDLMLSRDARKDAAIRFIHGAGGAHPWQALFMFRQGRRVADALGNAHGVRGPESIFGVTGGDA